MTQTDILTRHTQNDELIETEKTERRGDRDRERDSDKH